jgi:hypothetical protein
MPVTIHVNGTSDSLVHKGSNCIARCTMPDVCKTPSPAGPVPIPYPVIVSMSSDLANGSTTVKADGGNMIAIKDCEFSRCTGDEAGTAGGVVSSTFGKEAKFILYSFDVKIDGGNACRLSDKMTMNHQNTMCLAGVVQVPVPAGGDPKDVVCCVIERCDRKHYDVSESEKPCTDLGTEKHKCVENSLKDDPRFKTEVSYDMLTDPPEPILLSNGAPANKWSAKYIMEYYYGSPLPKGSVKRPDVSTSMEQPMQIYDAKFPCSEKVKGGKTSGRMDSDKSRSGASMMDKDQRDAYEEIAGDADDEAEVTALSPGDCKGSCEKCE